MAKCLTVCEPWATALVYGVKPIENRPGFFGVRGDLVIQAGKSLEWFTEEACRQLHAAWPAFPENRVAALDRLKGGLGHALGIIHITECVKVEDALARGFTADRHFAWGPWCLIQNTAEARRFRSPIPTRGQQGIFYVPDWYYQQDVIGRKVVGVPKGKP